MLVLLMVFIPGRFNSDKEVVEETAENLLGGSTAAKQSLKIKTTTQSFAGAITTAKYE